MFNVTSSAYSEETNNKPTAALVRLLIFILLSIVDNAYRRENVWYNKSSKSKQWCSIYH